MVSYPLPKFHFRVEWGGNNLSFAEVTGLNIEIEPIEYSDGLNPQPRKMPGKIKYENIVLRRGVFASDNEFFDWLNTVNLNKIERRDLIISLLNEEHEPVMVWNVRNAWPTKVTSTELNAESNESATHTIEVVCEEVSIKVE